MLNTNRRFKVLMLNIEGINDWTVTKLSKILGHIGGTITTLVLLNHQDPTPLKMSHLVKVLKNMTSLKYIKNNLKYRIEFDIRERKLPFLGLNHTTLGLVSIISKVRHFPVLELTSFEYKVAPGSCDNFLIPGWALVHVILDEIFMVDTNFFRSVMIKELTYKANKNQDKIRHNVFLRDLLSTQRHIEKLDLYNCQEIPIDMSVIRHISIMTKLKELSLSIAKTVAPDDLLDLANLRKLRNLLIVTKESGPEMLKIFVELRFLSLEVLEIDGFWPNFDENVLRAKMSTNWPKLHTFFGTLREWSKDDVPINLQVFMDSLPSLETLHIYDHSIKLLQHGHFPALREIVLEDDTRHFYEDDDDDIEFDPLTPAFFNALPNLTVLKLSMYFNVNQATMQAVLGTQLKELELSVKVFDESELMSQIICSRMKFKVLIY